MLRQRYDSLIPESRATKIWTCSAQRDVETAEHFADGFFGTSWRTDGSAIVEVISEEFDRGANTLTPGNTCSRYIEDKVDGHDKGYGRLADWQNHFAGAIATKLVEYTAGVHLEPIDVYLMFEMCGFEILARGSSPWCDVFTSQELLEFEYARDILHYYRAGPGNEFAATMGWLWLNATKNLLLDTAANDAFFSSFVHDGDIVPMLATLGIYDELPGQEDLQSNRMFADRRWKTSDLVPMGGRLIFELVTCDRYGSQLGRSAIRLFINDALVNLERLPLAEAFIDVEGAISLSSFQTFVERRGVEVGDFRLVCGLSSDAPARIDFLRQ
jgi:acid phosphatase